MLSFIQAERLHWETLTPSSDSPFTNSTDYKILFNDWPYGIDRSIAHLVCWTKFLLDDDPDTGDITEDTRNLVEQFVVQLFCGHAGMKRTDLAWFKNWRSLKSVHAIEHFHIMIYNPPKEFLEKITGGDRPMSERLQNGA